MHVEGGRGWRRKSHAGVRPRRGATAVAAPTARRGAAVRWLAAEGRGAHRCGSVDASAGCPLTPGAPLTGV